MILRFGTRLRVPHHPPTRRAPARAPMPASRTRSRATIARATIPGATIESAIIRFATSANAINASAIVETRSTGARPAPAMRAPAGEVVFGCHPHSPAPTTLAKKFPKSSVWPEGPKGEREKIIIFREKRYGSRGALYGPAPGWHSHTRPRPIRLTPRALGGTTNLTERTNGPGT